jgi:hypothetical protein
MNHLDKRRLLELMVSIAPGRGTAERESDDETVFLKNFLPVPDYRHALEPDTLLILGGRGVGKTELFRLLAMPAGRETLVKQLKIRALPSLNKTRWIASFGRTPQQEKTFPAPEIVEEQMQNASSIDWRAFWIGLMLGVILKQESNTLNMQFARQIPEATRIALTNLSKLKSWFPLVRQDLEQMNSALDDLDEQLLQADEYLFVTYDELDRLVFTRGSLAAPIRELLAFWLDRWRRWKRIRPKIFLRTDLFQEEFLGFPDASKLRSHQIRLEWSYSWLYRLLVKRLANSGKEMTEYLNSIVPNIIATNDPSLGLIPTSDESIFEQLIEKIAGKFMGANARKGVTYRWIPNHLQDAGSLIAPRSFLKLFSLAAERSLKKLDPSLTETTLIDPSDLQGALMDTSEDRIRELAQEEYPWLEALKTSLKGLELPIEKERFLESLQKTNWSEQTGKKPPNSNPEEVLKYLLQLGIASSRSDGRINMPEIYMYGFGLKRRGGVKRPK